MSLPDRLRRINPADLPAPPQAVLRVLQACADPDVDSRRLASVVESDPALAAQLLKVANSPYFAVSGGVRTVARAVSVLGQRALRNMVLCIGVRDAMRGDAAGGFDASRYWESALHRAVAARRLAVVAGVDAEEGFTVGLLLDLGMLALLHVYPEHLGMWSALAACDPDERYELERDLFGVTHDDVGGALVEAWGLPAEIASPLARHHRLTGGEDAMVRVAAAADWVAAVFDVPEKRRVIECAREVLAGAWQLGTEQADELIAHVAVDTAEAARALGIEVPEPVPYEALLREANMRLVEENLSFQDLTLRLESVLRQRDRLEEERRQELDKARVIQRSLLPSAGEPGLPFVGVNVPAMELSGDFYDYFRLPDGRYWFNLADVSGKGMDAALMMAKTSSLFRCLGKSLNDPSHIMAIINREVFELSARGMFVTMVGGIYEPDTGSVRLVNAGHPPPLLYGADGRFSAVPPGAPPLGIMDSVKFPVSELNVRGASLYMFSDGLTERGGQMDSEQGYAAVVQAIRDCGGISGRDRVLRLVATSATDNVPPGDDVTVLMLSTAEGA